MLFSEFTVKVLLLPNGVVAVFLLGFPAYRSWKLLMCWHDFVCAVLKIGSVYQKLHTFCVRSAQDWLSVSETTHVLKFFVLLLPVTDTPREDLLTHFENTSEFIKAGQEQGVVLVHW